ncbi:ABC-2 transporter permease [Cerasibacillus terrae]|uniref:ABC-2 transporter permease n=1 Tax=Cerasibacillus terrae TaxID=2498845 RepID=A0A5C8NV66_9BACI|nr:ABC-2 transporter permease [Cerasibacillus terrae]TXL64930.1 ABC-2 transporter permease [Cerasibacillus terrae]
MLHLIKKDLVMHKLAWFTFLAMLIFFMLFDKNQIFVIALMSAVVMTNAFYYEEDINGHKLWNALPYTRNEIVSARYSSLLIVFFVIATAVIMVGLVLKNEWELGLLQEVIGSLIVLFLAGAVCFPLFFWFGQKNTMFMLFVIYIFLVIGGTYAFYYLYRYMNQSLLPSINLSGSWLFVIASLMALCMYLFSWRLSVKIYQTKEIL